MATLSEKVGADGRKTYQHRSASLFAAVDGDGSGQIDKNEFGKLYDLIKVEVQEELAKEKELEKKAARSKRQMKTAWCVAAILLSIVGLSVAANGGLMYIVVDVMKDSKVSADGSLKVKGTDQNVQVDAATHNMEFDSLNSAQNTIADEILDSKETRSNTLAMDMTADDGFALHAKVEFIEMRSPIPMQYVAGQPVNVAHDGTNFLDSNLKLEVALIGLQHPLYPAIVVTRVTPTTSVGSLQALGSEYEARGAFMVNTTDLVLYQDIMFDSPGDFVGYLWEEYLPWSSAQTSSRNRQLKGGGGSYVRSMTKKARSNVQPPSEKQDK